MSSSEEDLMAIPRLAASIGETRRVLRSGEEQGLISPTRQRGKLRYSPRDLAIARLVKRLLDTGVGIEGLRMLKTLSEREIRTASERGDETLLSELALRILYERKAFQHLTGRDEEHYPEGTPPPHHPPPPPPPPPPSDPPPHAAGPHPRHH